MNCSQWGACQPLGSPQGGTGLLFGGSLGFPPVKGRKPGFLMKGGGPRSRKGTNVSFYVADQKCAACARGAEAPLWGAIAASSIIDFRAGRICKLLAICM